MNIFKWAVDLFPSLNMGFQKPGPDYNSGNDILKWEK